MATDAPSGDAVLSAIPDAIRVVPLALAGDAVVPVLEPGAAPAPAAHLTYRNGPLISSAEVVTIFWGASWQGAQASLAQNLNAFYDLILKSPLMDQLGEYGVPGKTIGHGSRIATATVTTPAPPGSVTDAQLRQMLQQWISARTVPPAGPNRLYMMYLPPGVAVVMGGSRSCQAFCGYHNSIGSSLFYGVHPYPGCRGCLGGLAALDALTEVSSHELCEAVTDPIPGQGWYDDVNGEIGDICAWQTKKVGQYTVQLEWSNKSGKCL